MSPNLKFHTPANPQICTEQTHESNGMFLDEPWRLGHCFQSSCLLPLSFVMARSLFDSQWTGFGGTCRSRKDVAGSIFGDYRPFQSPKELAVHFSLLLVQPGATQFLCDLEMSNSGSTRKTGSPPATLEVWTEKTLSVEGTEYIHFTACIWCTQCFARFLVSPTFWRANFWWIAPIIACVRATGQTGVVKYVTRPAVHMPKTGRGDSVHTNFDRRKLMTLNNRRSVVVLPIFTPNTLLERACFELNENVLVWKWNKERWNGRGSKLAKMLA